MMRKTFYLEASTRTQDLLDTQRALRAAEYGIGSTWHEELASSHSSEPEAWITQRFEELNRCDALIVLCGDSVKTPLQELGSAGEFGWGGFFYTAFEIDPKEDMITVFMAQLHPADGQTLDRMFHALAYQAIVD